MKKKLLAMSILSIVMCVSLIIGATFALFTSESKVNIAVTSGTVDVEATLSENVKLYSMGKEMGNAFENGGTASVEGGKLILDNITPGDKAEVTISVKNNSTVAIKYRAMVSCSEGQELYSRLVIAGASFGAWTDLSVGQDPATIVLSIELPAEADNASQNLNTQLTFTVEAVQGNADTSNIMFVQATADARANGDALQAALQAVAAQQASGETDATTIYVGSGTYDLHKEFVTPGIDGQTGYFMPIAADNLTLIGIGNVVLTSTQVTANGVHADQSFVMIFGDNVTLDGFTVKSKMDSNKAFEIMGANSVLRNISVECNDIVTYESYLEQKGITAGSGNDYWEGYSQLFPGSVYYTGEIGNAVLENVTVNKSWLSTGSVTGGTISATNLLLDYAGSWYSGYSGVISANAKDIFAEGSSLKIVVDENYADLQELVNIAPEGTTILLTEGNYDIESFSTDGYGLEIANRVTLCGEGEGTVLTVGGTPALSSQAYIYITESGVTLSDLTIRGTQTGYDLVKVSSRNSLNLAEDLIADVTISNVTFTGEADTYLNLHGTTNAVVENCVIGEESSSVQIPLSVAASKGVVVSGSKIGSGSWGAVGLMHNPNNANAYPFGSDVTFEECDIAGLVYIEEVDASGSSVSGLGEGWLEQRVGNYLNYVKLYEGDVVVEAGADEKVNGEKFSEAITGAADGATIYVAEGNYDIPMNDTVTVNNEKGLYLPITANGVTIIGDGAVLTSSQETPGDSIWAQQNFITISGDDVTLEGFTVISKAQANKAIEVLGKNVTLRNIKIQVNENNDEAFGGSVYFNPVDGNVGTATLQNVEIEQAWLTGGTGLQGKIVCDNVLIDYVGCAYAGTYDPVSEKITEIIEVAEGGLTVKIDSAVTARLQNLVDNVPANTTIEFASGHYAIASTNSSSWTISKPLTLIGATETEAVYDKDTVVTEGAVAVSEGTLFTRTSGDSGVTNLIRVTAAGVTFKNITFDSAIWNDDGQKNVAILLMVEASGFNGENLYFNNVTNNGLQLNHGNDAVLNGIHGNTYLADCGNGQIIVGVVASENVSIKNLTVQNLQNGSAVWTYQQTVSVTIENMSVEGSGQAFYMDLENTPTWWDSAWGEFKGNHTVTLKGSFVLGEGVNESLIQDADESDEFTGTVVKG